MIDGAQLLSLYPTPRSIPDVTLERLWAKTETGTKRIIKTNNRINFIRLKYNVSGKGKKLLKKIRQRSILCLKLSKEL